MANRASLRSYDAGCVHWVDRPFCPCDRAASHRLSDNKDSLRTGAQRDCRNRRRIDRAASAGLPEETHDLLGAAIYSAAWAGMLSSARSRALGADNVSACVARTFAIKSASSGALGIDGSTKRWAFLAAVSISDVSADKALENWSC
jgi:hypothetical protein